VKNEPRKRALYLAIVRSQFEHCSPVWSPSGSTSLDDIESIQRRAVRWILAEPHRDYSFEPLYHSKLQELDLLPMKYHLAYNDITLLYKIINKLVPIVLPPYIRPITDTERTRLRNTRKGISWLVIHREERTNILKNSFFHRSIHTWNNLPCEIKALALVPFQIELRKFFWNEITQIYETESDESFLSSDSDN